MTWLLDHEAEKKMHIERVWILGAFSWEMNEVERVLKIAGERFFYAKVFLEGNDRTRVRSREEAFSLDACADIGELRPGRAYFIDCRQGLVCLEECPVCVSFSNPGIIEQVKAELEGLGRWPVIDWVA